MKKNENKKSFKKPIIFGAMLALLTLIGVSGSQTYAKYVSSATTDTQNATVAKWGYTMTSNAEKFFSTKYDGSGKVSGSGLAIVSSSSSKVIAPGANGEMTFSVSGSSEVLAKLDITATGTDISLSAGGKTYNPVKWTLTEKVDGGVESALKTNDTLANCIAALNAKDIASIPANDTDFAREYKLSYVWAFDSVDDSGLKCGSPANTTVTGDVADTILGTIANQDGVNTFTYDEVEFTAVREVSVNISMTVTQIQA